MMMEYLTDTHSLIWYLARPGRLGAQAKDAFEQIGRGEARLYVPVIVLAELIFIAESGRVQVDVTAVLDALQMIPNVQVIDLCLDRVRSLQTLTDIPEMHDRIIVAEAIEIGATLITRDNMITASKIVPTIW